MDILDRIFTLKVILKGRTDSLRQSSYLTLLTLLRHLNAKKLRANTIGVFYYLRVSYRQQTKTQINTKMKVLVNDGYVIKSGTSWKVTPAGQQALKDIERQLNECTFKLRKSDTLKISVKRPKTI